MMRVMVLMVRLMHHILVGEVVTIAAALTVIMTIGTVFLVVAHKGSSFT